MEIYVVLFVGVLLLSAIAAAWIAQEKPPGWPHESPPDSPLYVKPRVSPPPPPKRPRVVEHHHHHHADPPAARSELPHPYWYSSPVVNLDAVSKPVAIQFRDPQTITVVDPDGLLDLKPWEG
jgi:hypothetical protein